MRCRPSSPACLVANLPKFSRSATPYRHHPVTQGALVSPIGLSLDAPTTTAFEAGEVYSVRAGLTDGAEQHAIVSAMIAVRDDGTEVLWRSGIA